MQFFGEDCALRVVALKILFRPEEKDVQMANASPWLMVIYSPPPFIHFLRFLANV